jgi:hypothetical protein
MPRTPSRKTRRRELIERICLDGEEVAELARSLSLGWTDLVEVGRDPQCADAAAALLTLAQWRFDCFLLRYQVHAIVRLVELSAQRDDMELARRASVDLLKVTGSSGWSAAGGDDSGSAAPPADGTPADSGDLLAALKQLGATGATGNDPDDPDGAEA